MSSNREKLNDLSRYILVLLILAIFIALSLIVSIALLSDWPKMLHGSGNRPAIDNHNLTVHEAVAIAYHERSILS
jgi:hypothetical protein